MLIVSGKLVQPKISVGLVQANAISTWRSRTSPWTSKGVTSTYMQLDLTLIKLLKRSANQSEQLIVNGIGKGTAEKRKGREQEGIIPPMNVPLTNLVKSETNNEGRNEEYGSSARPRVGDPTSIAHSRKSAGRRTILQDGHLLDGGHAPLVSDRNFRHCACQLAHLLTRSPAATNASSLARSFAPADCQPVQCNALVPSVSGRPWPSLAFPSRSAFSPFLPWLFSTVLPPGRHRSTTASTASAASDFIHQHERTKFSSCGEETVSSAAVNYTDFTVPYRGKESIDLHFASWTTNFTCAIARVYLICYFLCPRSTNSKYALFMFKYS